MNESVDEVKHERMHGGVGKAYAAHLPDGDRHHAVRLAVRRGGGVVRRQLLADTDVVIREHLIAEILPEILIIKVINIFLSHELPCSPELSLHIVVLPYSHK